MNALKSQKASPTVANRLTLCQPRPRLVTAVKRSMADVDERLANTFRELVRGKKPWPLFLHGAVGTGKSYAALALADCVVSASYHTVDQLCLEVRELNESAAAVSAFWEWLDSKDLAICDELGTRNTVSDFQYETLKRFIDGRELSGHQAAIFISNHGKKALSALYDARIISRICRGTICELTGSDRRSATR